MLTERESLELVRKLRQEGKKYMNVKPCPFCKRGKQSFFIYDRGSYVDCYCFRCHKYAKLSDSKPSFSTSLQLATECRARIKWRKNKRDNHFTPEPKTYYEALPMREVWLPWDCTSELPTKARLWLLKYHITQEEIYRYNFQYSEQYKRLILPVYKDGRLVYWTGRYFGEECDQPKYLNIKAEKNDVVFDVGPESSPYLVLVEDILSAIAVGRAGYRAFALLGCQVQDSVLESMQRQCKQATVVLWLDQDKMGTSFKKAKRLEVLGFQTKVVVTPLDPKEYKPDQIKTFLQGGSSHAIPDQSFQVQQGDALVEEPA